MLTCQGLRTGVLLSTFLLILGLVLGAIAETTPWVIPTTHLALFAVLAGAAVLAITFLASLIPGTARHFTKCQH
jgi:hypothetical protein